MRATYFLAQAGESVAVESPAGGPGGGGLPGRCCFTRLQKHLIDGWDPAQTLHLCIQRHVFLLHMSSLLNAKQGLAVGGRALPLPRKGGSGDCSRST